MSILEKIRFFESKIKRKSPSPRAKSKSPSPRAKSRSPSLNWSSNENFWNAENIIKARENANNNARRNRLYYAREAAYDKRRKNAGKRSNNSNSETEWNIRARHENANRARANRLANARAIAADKRLRNAAVAAALRRKARK